MMRTTISLDERLLKAAKRAAAGRGISFTKLVEEALREALYRPAPPQARVELPRSTASGPPRPGIDLNDSRSLRDLDLL